MKIVVNGTPADVRSNALSAILDELGFGSDRVATAVNETFVPALERHKARLEPGDRLEIVTPRQGG